MAGRLEKVFVRALEPVSGEIGGAAVAPKHAQERLRQVNEDEIRLRGQAARPDGPEIPATPQWQGLLEVKWYLAKARIGSDEDSVEQ